MSTNSKQDNNSDIAIIGIGALFPKAKDLNQYWANISGGIDAIENIPGTHWSPDDFFNSDKSTPDHTYANRGGFIPVTPFRPMDYGIPPHTIEATDTSQLLGLHVADQALQDAGYQLATLSMQKLAPLLALLAAWN